MATAARALPATGVSARWASSINTILPTSPPPLVTVPVPVPSANNSDEDDDGDDDDDDDDMILMHMSMSIYKDRIGQERIRILQRSNRIGCVGMNALPLT